MSEWRQDPLSGRWVIVAPDRRGRPNEFADVPQAAPPADDCPFCPGHESRTTAECLVHGRPPGAAADGPGWRLRVFPNLYPALTADRGPDPREGPGRALAAYGHHEVLVPTPDHGAGLQDLPQADLVGMLAAMRERCRALAADPEVRHVLVFANQGAAAGATLAHAHGQILAGTMVPALVREKLERLDDHHRQTGGCLLCDLVQREEAAGSRLVAACDGAVALAPWASRFPYEVMIVPRRHADSLDRADDADLEAVGAMLRRALEGLAEVAPSPPLNLVVQGGPVPNPQGPAVAPLFHWHLEILPRLAGLAGFEAGSGFAINSVPPETAACRLRGEEG